MDNNKAENNYPIILIKLKFSNID